jgi:hypothetical protein
MERIPVSLSAYASVVTQLPREEKEKLLRVLARECGYLLEPAPKVREDFQRKLFLDGDD